MKKTNVLAAALVAAVISMGAGYAAWTDTLNINTTVATGNLDVDFVGANVVYQAGNSDVALGTATAAENDAVIALTNLYPGAVATVTLPVKNNGSIPVKNGNLNFTGVPDWLDVQYTPQPTLAVAEQENVVLTMTVAEDAPQSNPNVTFTAQAVYDQFNK